MDFRAGLEEATAPALRGSATGSAYALIVGALDLSAFSAGQRQRLRRVQEQNSGPEKRLVFRAAIQGEPPTASTAIRAPAVWRSAIVRGRAIGQLPT